MRKPKRFKSRSFFFLSPPQPLLLCTVNLQNFAALGLIAFFFLTFLLTGQRKEKKSKNKQIHKQKMEEGEEERKKERKKERKFTIKLKKKILKSNFFSLYQIETKEVLVGVGVRVGVGVGGRAGLL